MPSSRPRIPRNALILAFVALASGFGQDLITPILPAYLILLGASHSGIGLIDGLLQGSTNIFRFVSGVLSDRFHNRKWFVFFGYVLSSISRPLLALTGTFSAIASLRVLDGVGKGTKDAPRDALIADSAALNVRGRAFGFQRFVDTAGSVLGPLAAAAMLFLLLPSLQTYHLIFFLAIIPGAIALVLIWFGVREPDTMKKRKRPSSTHLGLSFWLFTIATAIAMLTKINDLLFLTRAHDLGMPPTWIPILFAGFTLVYAVLSYPIGIWSDRIGRLPLIAIGWLLLSAVEYGFAHESGLLLALPLFALYGLFYALTEGSGRAFIADLVVPESRGTAYAIFYTMTGVAVIVGGFGIGRIWDVGSPHAAFSIASFGSLIGFMVFLVLLYAKKRPSVAATSDV